MTQLPDADWIAAKKAVTLAHGEMMRELYAAPYDSLPPVLAAYKKNFIEAQAYVARLQQIRDTCEVG